MHWHGDCSASLSYDEAKQVRYCVPRAETDMFRYWAGVSRLTGLEVLGGGRGRDFAGDSAVQVRESMFSVDK